MIIETQCTSIRCYGKGIYLKNGGMSATQPPTVELIDQAVQEAKGYLNYILDTLGIQETQGTPIHRGCQRHWG